jgi:cytosine/uracil/thiamine/allantoin permease
MAFYVGFIVAGLLYYGLRRLRRVQTSQAPER